MPLRGPAAAPVHGGVRAQRQQEEAPRAPLHAAQRGRTGAGRAEQGAGAPLAQSKALKGVLLGEMTENRVFRNLIPNLTSGGQRGERSECRC